MWLHSNVQMARERTLNIVRVAITRNVSTLVSEQFGVTYLSDFRFLKKKKKKMLK